MDISICENNHEYIWEQWERYVNGYGKINRTCTTLVSLREELLDGRND